MKRIQPYLLITMICISAIAMTIAGYIFHRDLYPTVGSNIFTDPPIEIFMMTLKDSKYLDYFSDTAVMASAHATNYFNGFTLSEEEQVTNTDWDNIPRKFTKVNENYFKDALFIGDSRTVGIASYAGFKEGTFYAATSLNIFDFNKKKIPIDDQKMTIEDALTKHQFNKIYVMIGINDVGISTVDTFFNSYSEVIKKISELQPDALIFLEANLHVTKEKSENDKTINNINIEKRNRKIATLADQKRIFYIDVNDSVLCDKEGNLKAEYTWDQVHLQAKYYPIWKNFIMQNGIVIKTK